MKPTLTHEAMGIALVLGLSCGCLGAGPSQPPTAQTYRQLADEAEQQLRTNVLGVWFPRCIDEQRGGFDSNFSRDWTREKPPGAFIVFEARMTWITATVAMRRPDLRQQYLPYARHGLEFLKSTMSDRQRGGMFWELGPDGKPLGNAEKHAYGISFGIYGAAAAYDATHDKSVLDLALATFRWFDQHAHDDRNGGYHESLSRDGTPLPAGDLPAPAKFMGGGFPIGYKTMNAHIHLLEAITELYRVSKDPLAKKRLEEMLEIVRDKIAVPPGCLDQYFTEDWRPAPDLDSFGHDIETAYLMMEAAGELGRTDDAKTLAVGKQLVDHALALGWDEEHGGFYDAGPAFDPARDRRKTWWVQFEGLNALLLMHEHYGSENQRYWDAFVKTWRFITQHMADQQYGGFYAEVEADGTVKSHSKAQPWKAAYHDGRALLNTADTLRKLAAR